MMAQFRQLIISMFGGEHLSSDEDTMENQQILKQRLYETFGTDSESDERREDLEADNTDISEPEDSSNARDPTRKTTEELSDEIDLRYSDFEDKEKPMTLQPIRRIHANTTKPRTIHQAKALAQYRRQMEARITKYNHESTIQIPRSIVAVDTIRQQIIAEEEEIADHETDVIPLEEKTIRGRNVVEATMEWMCQRGGIPEQKEEADQEPEADRVDIPTKTSSHKGRRTAAAKRAWYKKKRTQAPSSTT